MSYLTKIVIFCSSADPAPAERIETALLASTAKEDSGLSGGFFRVDDNTHPYVSSGSGTTFVGTINYLDETLLKNLLADASHSTDGWNWYAPLTVILRNQDADNLPTIFTLDDDGNWNRAA